ncbi:MAG: lactonase family protein [Chloroflexi bacterium]|nr:lactonase family protein [Chloroflexota bacterium]
MATYAYVGCYTTPDRDGQGNGINVYEMDQRTGRWTHLQLLDGIGNPSWLSLGPDGDTLYSVHGGNDFSEVSAYAIDRATGRISPLGAQSCGGPNPVAISVSPLVTYAVVAVYNAGKVAALPVNPDGSLGPMSDLVTLVGQPGPHPTEQNVSHPHHIPIAPDGKFFVVPDKGYDRTYVFSVDADGKIAPSAQGSVQARPGAAPRHFAFHPTRPLAYQCNEIDSTVTTFAYDAATGQLDELEVQTTLPAGFEGRNSTAEIMVARSGRFVYVSNRGHNSIAIFAVDAATGKLTPIGWEPTQGAQPRFFSFDPTGTFLYAANQASHTVVTFRVDTERGTLTPTGQTLEIGSPVTIAFRQT